MGIEDELKRQGVQEGDLVKVLREYSICDPRRAYQGRDKKDGLK